MDTCNSIDHIAEDNIHTSITHITEKPKQRYSLGTVNNRLLGDLKHVLSDY